MEIKADTIFGLAVGLAVSAITFVIAKDKYDTAKEKFSGVADKAVSDILTKVISQEK